VGSENGFHGSERINGSSTSTQGTEDFSLLDHEQCDYVLFRWKEWSHSNEPNGWIARVVTDPNRAIRLLRRVISISIVNGVKRVPFLNGEALEKFIDLEILHRAVVAVPVEKQTEEDQANIVLLERLSPENQKANHIQTNAPIDLISNGNRFGMGSGVASTYLTFFKELIRLRARLRRDRWLRVESVKLVGATFLYGVESKPEKRIGSLRSDGKRFRVAVSTGTCPVTGQAAHNT
jgi:hypothetical protein